MKVATDMGTIEFELDPSVRLAWLIANCEASLANYDSIRPAHMMLAVLKILDNNYSRVAEAMKYSEDELKQITDMAALCRPLLHLSENELTKARRGLSKALHDQESGERPSRLRMLKWSGAALYLHRKSGVRAAENGLQTITLMHLLEELLANLPLEAAPFFKNHPTSQLLTDMGEADGSYVKYDSPLWNVSEEPD